MAQTEVAAKITKASGPVSVERNGERVELNQGDTVYATDVIYTQKSAIELLFTDGAIANLSPNSTLKIQEFSYDTGEDPAFVMSLARGAMRTLSGKLVELNPDAFKVLTPKATAGIRGTEFVTIVRLDGSEQYTLLNIDPGHNFVVTSHNGTQISLSISGGNIVIAAGSDTDMSEGAITQEEAFEIIQDILGLLTADDASVVLTNPFTQLQLDASAKTALQEGLLEVFASLTAEDVNILGSDDDSDGNDDPLDGVAPPPVIVAVVESEDAKQEIKYPVSTSGELNFYADDDVAAVNGVIQTLSHIVSITGTNDTADVVNISGDVNIVEDATVVGGNDDIIGGHIQRTHIAGDAISVLGNLEAGDDTITFYSLTDSYISGDALFIETGTVFYGSDTIIITEDVTNSYIFGDVNNDAFDSSGNNDTITIGGELHMGVVDGDGGNDKISIGSVTDDYAPSIVKGGAGSDTITIGLVDIGAHSNGIYGDDGEDTIIVTTLKAGGLSGDDDNDFIEVKSFEGGGIVGGNGEDTITATIAYTGNDANTRPYIYLESDDSMADIVNLWSTAGDTSVAIQGATSSDVIKAFGEEVGRPTGGGNSITVNNADGTSSLTIYFT